MRCRFFLFYVVFYIIFSVFVYLSVWRSFFFAEVANDLRGGVKKVIAIERNKFLYRMAKQILKSNSAKFISAFYLDTSIIDR